MSMDLDFLGLDTLEQLESLKPTKEENEVMRDFAGEVSELPEVGREQKRSGRGGGVACTITRCLSWVGLASNSVGLARGGASVENQGRCSL